MKPDVTARKPSPHDDYLPSRIPPALNLLQSFEHDPALAGIHPRLSAMRISKIAPSAPLAREMARPIKTGQRPLFRVVPPLMWRTRFAAVHASLADLSLLASLDIEVASYTSYAVRITSVDVSLLGGAIKPLTPAAPSTPCSPGDQLSYLYKATPDLGPDGTPALGSKGHTLTLRIHARIHVAADCTPAVAITWKTPVDFASEAHSHLLQAAHRLSSASQPALAPAKSPDALPAPPEPAAQPAINLTLTVTGPPRVTVGSPFTWSVFIVNRAATPRRLAIMVLPKRKRDTTRPASSSSASNPRSLAAAPSPSASASPSPTAPAVLDEATVYGRQKGAAAAEPATLVCLATDVRLGQLAAGSCFTAEVRFVALAAGVQGVECVRVVDLGTGETADVRDLPRIVAVGGG